jgi:uncharacterized phage protein (TIGR02218 family)
MSRDTEGLYAHLASGATTLCRAWSVKRSDGETFGFTDHDLDLVFEGMTFRASSGLTAKALQQSTGLSIDNTEAVGALNDASIREEDLMAGRFDGAEVRSWLVNWANVAERVLQFRGTFGEIARAGGAFRAELRGLSEALNQPRGRVYQRECSALLGDRECGVNLSLPTYASERRVEVIENRQLLRFTGFAGFGNQWFERGRMVVLSGDAAGLVGLIKTDRIGETARTIELWQAFGLEVRAGDMVRLEAGCDKRSATCRVKFDNYLNFRGFPHIPGEDWLSAFPSSRRANDGGSMVE